MNADKNLNGLLKWSIEAQAAANANADGSSGQEQQSAPTTTTSQLTPEMLSAIMGGPSDAELMQAAVANITSADPEITLDSKLTAFDNLEQLIESIDNANMLGKLGLWTPLLELLAHEESQIRLMAAWVIGTAVQNNEPCQERLVALGGVEKLVAMSLGHKAEGEGEAKETKEIRRKAVYALSSAVRNYQPAMDVATRQLAARGVSVPEKTDATDMDSVDLIITDLREKAAAA